jgi:thiol-disulfide isomerase/thioredoxin
VIATIHRSRPGLLAFAFALAVAPVLAADTPAKTTDPKAHQLLVDVAKAYKDLASYSDQGGFTIAATVGGKAEKQTFPLRLTFARPNKVNLDAGEVRLVSDGKTLTTAIGPFKKYTEAPAPKAFTFDTFREGPIGSALFGGPTGAPMLVLANLLVGDDPVKVIEALGESLKVEDDREAGGVPCRSLLIDREPGAPDIRLLADSRTKLLKAIDFVIDPKDLQKGPDGAPVKIDKLGWDSGAVSTSAPQDAAFAYKAPEGFTKVESFARAAGGAEEKNPVEELVGLPAPDFTLTLLDGPGKTRTVSKADLAGKVVMIDFWATWCGPCMAELPEVQKMIESYAKDKKDVLIVALSQDKEPAEPAEVRKLVEKTLDDKKIVLTGTPVGQVGLDPSGSVGDAFKVEAIPTVVILDGKGVVQSAHVGFSPDVRETLTKDIDALLAGKALAKPKPVEAEAKGGEKK